MSALLVTIKCPKCGREAQVWVLNAWDIARVRHGCDADVPFVIEFDPPRPVF